jgi:uncharacterized protein
MALLLDTDMEAKRVAFHRRTVARSRAAQIIAEHEQRRRAVRVHANAVLASERRPGLVRHAGGKVLNGRDFGEDGRTLGGLACPFDVIATVDDGAGLYDEVFRQGAFARSIRVRSRIPVLVAHDRRSVPVGMTTMLEERQGGLMAVLQLGRSAQADDILDMIGRGWSPGLSVSFSPVADRRTPARQRAGGRDLVERLEVDLRELSVCVFPAYETAGIAV